MVLECLPYGILGSNSYIFGENGECVVIDAGVESDEIVNAASKHGFKIRYIFLTHGHIDHIYYIDELVEKTGAEVLIGSGDENALRDSSVNLSGIIEEQSTFNAHARVLNHGDIIDFAGIRFEIIHTPGHSPGGICIKANDKLFTGDTLFNRGIGRSDLRGGDGLTLIRSIKEKLMTMDDDVKVYPGHGEASTIGDERKYNMFLK